MRFCELTYLPLAFIMTAMSDIRPKTPLVTFRVLEGTDRGKYFPKLVLPLTIGREDGNSMRLDDERISRFHAKIQADGDEIILTDLESTNGTKVNGHVVSIRCLRPGDRIQMGRTILLYGSDEQIAIRKKLLESANDAELKIDGTDSEMHSGHSTVLTAELAKLHSFDHPHDIGNPEPLKELHGQVFQGHRPLPPIPDSLKPSEIARFAEVFDYLHRQMALSMISGKESSNGDLTEVPFDAWQRLHAVQMALGMYLRAITRRDD